jgi:hypothetical protein
VYRSLGMQRLGTWEEIELTIRAASANQSNLAR